MKRSITIILSIILVFAIVFPAAAISSIAVKSISLNNTYINLKVGQSSTLEAGFTPKNTTQKQLVYTTDDKNTANVDASGKITGVNAGTTNITVYSASNNKIFAKCLVTVISDSTITVTFAGMLTDQVQKTVLKDDLTFEKNPWTDAYEKELGVKVKYKWIAKSVDEYLQKQNISLASGDIPDILTGGPAGGQQAWIA